MSIPRPELDPFYAAVDFSAAPRPGELLRFREVDVKLEIELEDDERELEIELEW